MVVLLAGTLLAGGCTKKVKPTDKVMKEETKEEKTDLYVGEISQELSPFFYVTQGDQNVLSLMYLKVADIEEQEGTVETAGKIQTLKNQGADNTTVYRITIEEGKKDSQGNLLTAEDLLFNYYLRCESGYRGIDQVNQVEIVGLQEYQLGATGKKCIWRQKKIEKALAAPDKALRKRIRQELIIPILQKEYSWIEGLYEQKKYEKLTQKYPKPQLLFARFYAGDVTYKGKGKNREEIIKEIAKQYKGDYKKLSKITGENYEAIAKCIAIEKLFGNPSLQKMSIEGIRKIDEYTIEIETEGFKEKDKEKLANIFLLSRHSQQDIREGKYFSVGTGGYVGEKKNGKWILQANPYYNHQKPFASILYIKE